MSRTVHHVPYAHRDGNCANHDCAHTRDTIARPWWSVLAGSASCDFAGPDHTRTDLRYSTGRVNAAAVAGTRTVPEVVSATLLRNHGAARTWQTATISGAVRAQSRTDRRVAAPVLRAAAAAANGFASAGGHLGDWAEEDTVVVGPTRHHRSVRANYGW